MHKKFTESKDFENVKYFIQNVKQNTELLSENSELIVVFYISSTMNVPLIVEIYFPNVPKNIFL